MNRGSADERCPDVRVRLVSRESEWVTLSAIRVFRFICKHRLHCGGCTAVFPLTNLEFKEINRHMQRHDSMNGTDLHVSLTKRIETEQLASKTPLQLKFIRESMEAQKQYKSAIEAQSEPSYAARSARALGVFE